MGDFIKYLFFLAYGAQILLRLLKLNGMVTLESRNLASS
ncbi:hypothetical protein SEET0012_10087 [Salmonella enterica subsp. enterica serovar Tallahassee str. 0012]|nr:hypothetical protein SEET0012_10087 [Salmonella enterica subsp. enterica serovar Tallahassee str. 0012]